MLISGTFPKIVLVTISQQKASLYLKVSNSVNKLANTKKKKIYTVFLAAFWIAG